MTTSEPENSSQVSSSPQETQQFGRQLAPTLESGSTLLVCGDLGAGKTLLIKGIASGLGIAPDQVTSPTFTLVNEYYGDRFLVHVDVYRLENTGAFHSLDLDYYMDQDAVLLVEWGDRFLDQFPAGTRKIQIDIQDETRRLITESHL